MADRVIVWLGLGNPDSSLAFSTLHRLSIEMEFDWLQERFKSRPRRTDSSRASNPDELNNAVWRSLLYLLQNP